MNQAIDWPGIRAAAVALDSVRDAALRASSNLPPAEQTRFVERVNKRAYRERWLDVASELSNEPPKGMSKKVQTGADTLATVVSDNCTRARVALSKTALKAGEAFERLQGRSVIGKDKSVAFRNITAATAQIGGWDQDKGERGVNVAVCVGIIGS